MNNNINTIQSPEVKVVEASAGSGKTYALAKRYLQLVLRKDVDPTIIKSILAITFTNLASREMKEKILNFLRKIALHQFSSEEEKKEIYSSIEVGEKKASKKASRLMNFIIRNYNFFQVKTIDSFINVLLSGCAYKLNISANFKIEHDYIDYLDYGLDECIVEANYNKEIEKVFNNFLEKYVFLEDRYSWFPKDNILELINSLFYYHVTYGRNFRKFDLGEQDLFLEKKKIISYFKQLRDKIPEGTNKRFLNSLDKFLDEIDGSFDFSQLTSKKFTQEDFPVNKGYKVPTEVSNLWNEIQKKLTDVAKKEALTLFNHYIDIYRLVYERFKKHSSREDVMFLGELNREAKSLFDDVEITVPEIYYRLATRFKHYLIDEFQDTSFLQWENLKLMIEDALASGGSFFYVGDKKQAIYRFRGGEASLFDDIKEKLSNFNLTVSSLEKNYRSQKAIVEFNNSIFSQDNLEEFLHEQQHKDRTKAKYLTSDNIKEISSTFRRSEQKCKENKSGGYVKVEKIECNNKEERNEYTKERFLALIEKLKDRFQLKDIAVLIRHNRDVELVSSWLAEVDIAVESDKTLNVKNNRYIKELISFLKFLDSPIDNISFISFILGDIFSSATNIDKEELRDFFVKFQNENPSEVYLYRVFREEHPKIWEKYIENFFKNVGFVGFYELIIDIFQQLNILKNFPQYQGFFMHLLEMVKQKEDEYQTLGDFLEFFENTDKEDPIFYVYSSDTDAVKVMTIHKAKGLGFPVVILPFYELNRTQLSPTGGGKSSYIVRPFNDELALLRLDKKYTRFSSFIKKAYRDEHKRSFIDELNTLYVGCTRSKNEMYVFLPYGMRWNNNLAKYLIPTESYEIGKKLDYEEEKEETPAVEIIPAEYRNWIAFLKEEFIDINTIRNRKEVVKGEVLHYMLSVVRNLSEQDKKELIQQLKSEIKTEFPFYSYYDKAEEKFEQIINSQELKKFFYLGEEKVFTEKELVNKFGQTKRIDRLIVREREIWVIDYKLTKEAISEYKKQMKEYMGIVEEIYPNRTVKGFIIFLENLNYEEMKNGKE